MTPVKSKSIRKMALGGFILALHLLGFIGGYSLHSILETNRNALMYDKVSLQNSKGIGINLISSSQNHVLAKHSSRRSYGLRVGQYTSNKYYFLSVLLLVSNDVQQNPGRTSGSNTLCISSSGKEKAELFNNFFTSIFSSTSDFSIDAQPLHLHTDHVIADVVCSGANVEKLLLGLNTNKASGPDGVTVRLLREAVPSISSSLSCLFNILSQKKKVTM